MIIDNDDDVRSFEKDKTAGVSKEQSQMNQMSQSYEYQHRQSKKNTDGDDAVDDLRNTEAWAKLQKKDNTEKKLGEDDINGDLFDVEKNLVTTDEKD